MRNRLRDIGIYITGALVVWAFLCRPLGAGEIASGLSFQLEKAAPETAIPVIVTFTNRVDMARFRDRSKGIRRARMIRALKQRYEENLHRSSLKTLLQEKRGYEPIRPLWIINGVALKAGPNLIRRIAARPWVKAVKLDETTSLPEVDTANSAEPEWNLAVVGAPDLWNLGFTGQDVVVAGVDSGVDIYHPDLATRWRGGTNSWFDANDPDFDPELDNEPYDPDGHGTATMSIMVGGDAGGSAIGMAPGAQWIAAKVFDVFGEALESEILSALQWLLDPDGNPDTDDAPDVINNSWGFESLAGTCFEGSPGETTLRTEIQVLRQAGIAVVSSAGNHGPNPYTSVSPANYPESLAVGAVDEYDDVAQFSSRGPSACDGDVYPDLVAPGDRFSFPYGIKAADLTAGGVFPDSYRYLTGTSISAPHASGAMALLLSAFPDLAPAELEAALKASSLDLEPVGPDNDSGYGMLDVSRAYSVLDGSDVVAFEYVLYSPESGGTLTIAAVSSAQPDVQLIAEGFGPLAWKSWLNFYRNTFYGVGEQPNEITVSSSGGGTAVFSFAPADIVAIQHAIYDEAVQSLTVVATSSEQPEAALTAEGYGLLAWKSWLNFYRNTFYGVTEKPSGVTVISNGGGSDTQPVPYPQDTVTITNLIYDEAAQSLTVVATSSDQPDVALTAEGYGRLDWKSWLNFYRNTFYDIVEMPAGVTVTSSGGGSDSQPLP